MHSPLISFGMFYAWYAKLLGLGLLPKFIVVVV